MIPRSRLAIILSWSLNEDLSILLWGGSSFLTAVGQWFHSAISATLGKVFFVVVVVLAVVYVDQGPTQITPNSCTFTLN